MSGEADALRARLAQIAADLGHIDAVIRLFDPDHDIAAIRPKRPRDPDAAGRGKRGKLVLDVLQGTAGPIPAAEVVRRMLARQEQDAGDVRLVRAVTKRVEAALARQEKRGVVRAMREAGKAVMWGVAR